MTVYKVYECEEKMTNSGKALKKLVLQGEGKQYPDKNVTMWADHPLYEETVAGTTINVELDIKDGAPNPKGGFYKNKTVLKEGQPMRDDQGPAAANPGTAELKNVLTLKVIPLLLQIDANLKKLIPTKENSYSEEDLPFEVPPF